MYRTYLAFTKGEDERLKQLKIPSIAGKEKEIFIECANAL